MSTIAEDAALIQILASLHSWEVNRAPLMSSVSGRQLYYSVAPQALVMGRGPTVKEVVMAQHLTDRALRAKLAEMIRDGYFELGPSALDSRAKSLQPQDHYYDFLHAHVAEFRRLVENYFYLIERESVSLQKSA